MTNTLLITILILVVIDTLINIFSIGKDRFAKQFKPQIEPGVTLGSYGGEPNPEAQPQTSTLKVGVANPKTPELLEAEESERLKKMQEFK
jgi:hypothetical protein